MSPCIRRYIFPEPGRTLLVCLHESSTEFRYRFVCVRQASAVRSARPKPEETACSYFDQLPELKNYERSFFLPVMFARKRFNSPSLTRLQYVIQLTHFTLPLLMLEVLNSSTVNSDAGCRARSVGDLRAITTFADHLKTPETQLAPRHTC